MRAANAELADYGISITRLGNLDVNLDDDDNARLKKLAGDTAYSRLAGGFLQAAQAEALQGAGEGMAQGGAAVTPMFLGAGFGMANQMMQAPAQAPPAPPPPAPGSPGAARATRTAATAASAAAAAHRSAGSGSGGDGRVRELPQPGPGRSEVLRFECGTPMQKHCTNCNAGLSASAKFCAECGTPAPAAARAIIPGELAPSRLAPPAGSLMPVSFLCAAAARYDRIHAASAASATGWREERPVRMDRIECQWCKAQNEAERTSCSTCGAPLDKKNLVSDSGWAEAPRLRDMTEFRFSNSTCQIEGEIVPVAEMALAQGDSVFFEHHVMLWKEPARADVGPQHRRRHEAHDRRNAARAQRRPRAGPRRFLPGRRPAR